MEHRRARYWNCKVFSQRYRVWYSTNFLSFFCEKIRKVLRYKWITWNFILSNSSGKWCRVRKKVEINSLRSRYDEKYGEVLEISRERTRGAQTFRIIFTYPLPLANLRLHFNKVGSKVGWVWQVSSRFYSHGTQTSPPHLPLRSRQFVFNKNKRRSK